MMKRVAATVMGGMASTATRPATHVPPKHSAESVRMTYAFFSGSPSP